MEIVGLAATGREAVRFRTSAGPVTIMDMHSHQMSGTKPCNLFENVNFGRPGDRLSASQRKTKRFSRGLQAGAEVIRISSRRLWETDWCVIREVHEAAGDSTRCGPRGKLADRLSQPRLTPRELQIVQRVAEGMRTRKLAEPWESAEQTAQGHLKISSPNLR